MLRKTRPSPHRRPPQAKAHPPPSKKQGIWRQPKAAHRQQMRSRLSSLNRQLRQPPLSGRKHSRVARHRLKSRRSTDALENRLREFLQAYCSTYAAKDLDSFSRFFAPDAEENGKLFKSLLPKYQKNFSFIDTIYYRIELQQATYEDDGKTLKVDGNFFLRWLPPDKKWRENAGNIVMSLKADGASFIVQRLDYQSNRSKAQ